MSKQKAEPWRVPGTNIVREGHTTRADFSPPPGSFHDHLDTCAQCREHPFALCGVGARLLAAGEDA